jgi:hypothetical protein
MDLRSIRKMKIGKFRLVIISIVLFSIVNILLGCSGKPPTIESINPTAASYDGGTEITITGTGFKATRYPTVTVGGCPATGVKVVSETSLKVTVPAGVAGSADIIVQNAKAKSLPFKGFSYYEEGTAPETVTDTPPMPPKIPAGMGEAARLKAETEYIDKLAAPGLKAQEDYAKIAEKRLLNRGIDAYVTVTRPNHNTTMTIKYVLMSRPLMTMIMDDEFVSELKSIGYAKVIFTNGEHNIGTYDLLKK